MLVFPLQMAPLSKIPDKISNTIDQMIRGCIKSIIGLPANTSTPMFYAPRKYRGLAIFNCSWEKYLQHFSLVQRLNNLEDPLIDLIVNIERKLIYVKYN